jgi:hypothetical protein
MQGEVCNAGCKTPGVDHRKKPGLRMRSSLGFAIPKSESTRHGKRPQTNGGEIVPVLCPTFYYGHWNGVHYYFGDLLEADGACRETAAAQASVAHQLGGCQGSGACPDPIQSFDRGAGTEKGGPTGPIEMLIDRHLLQHGIGNHVSESLPFYKATASVRIMEEHFIEYEEIATLGAPSKRRQARLLLLAATPSPIPDRVIAIGQELSWGTVTFRKAKHTGSHPVVPPVRSRCQQVSYTTGTTTRTYHVITIA